MTKKIQPADQKSFAEVVQMIQTAKQAATQAVNRHLVELYWQVGAYITDKIEQA